MVCGNCLKQSSFVKLYPDGSERCHNCGNFSEAGGHKLDNILTRNSFRVRTEAYKFEGDTLLPHTYNKNTRKLDVNPEFVKLHPDKVKDYFTEDEITGAGMPKLAKKAAEQKAVIAQHKQNKAVEFVGDTAKAVERAVTP